jgi:hypothetical protein
MTAVFCENTADRKAETWKARLDPFSRLEFAVSNARSATIGALRRGRPYHPGPRAGSLAAPPCERDQPRTIFNRSGTARKGNPLSSGGDDGDHLSPHAASAIRA